MEAVIGHIRTDAVRWSPAKRPFDKTFSTRLSTQTKNLAAQAPRAEGAEIRRAVGSMATAFDGVAKAMQSKQRANVERAVERSRVAYKSLKQVCRLAEE